MTGKSSIFSGSFEDWEPVDSPSKGVDSPAPAEKPDRVASEFSKVVEKYGADSDAPGGFASEHATLLRAKKKGALDNDVNAKTFVFSDNKIVGSQG